MAKQKYYILIPIVVIVVIFTRNANAGWTHITGDNVTVPTKISDMAFDREDVLWVGNLYGLWSYDGVAWTTWWLRQGKEWLVPFPGEGQLPDSFVVTITVDNDNVKWITIPQGVIQYDGHVFSYTERGDHTLCAATVDQNNMKWFGTLYDGVWSYDETEWTQYSEHDIGMPHMAEIEAATVDSRNVKWFTFSDNGMDTQDYGITSFDGESWNSRVLGGISEWVAGPMSLAADFNDVIWIGTGEGVIRYDNDGSVTNYDYEYVGTDAVVYDIAVGADNVKWFGTGNHGVTSFDGTTWATYDSTNGLPDNQVLAIAIDRNNTKWFGTRTGISCLTVNAIPVNVDTSQKPGAVAITGNYPNPFNPATTIEFTLDMDADVRLEVYDISGQHIKTLMRGWAAVGVHTVVWNGTDKEEKAVASGIYFCRITAAASESVHRMILIR